MFGPFFYKIVMSLRNYQIQDILLSFLQSVRERDSSGNPLPIPIGQRL